MYDIVFVGERTNQWDLLKSRFPLIKYAKDIADARRIVFTKFFWIVWDNIIVDDSFDFSYVPDKWSQEVVHVFKNKNFYDGVCLMPKKNNITDRELAHRFFVNKKEIDLNASSPMPYDVVFISYQEPNADENYQLLLKKCPTAKRVHGVKGIHQAHIEAAKQCKTDMFWIVDGDALIMDDFNFDYQIPFYDVNKRQTVYVWRSKNPINDLVYGYGGIKLFPRDLTINMDTSKPDMTTSISNKFKAVPEISNITSFNSDPFNTWKSAFRECAKLSSKVIDRQKDDETDLRLRTWCTIGFDRPFGKYALDGAKLGTIYGSQYKNDTIELKKINDFDWLKEYFDARNI